MLLGALVGAVLILHVHIVAPLAIALIVTAIVTGASWSSGASDPPWVRRGH
jgi:multisubunit Na+/H+ antiporter MnhC subunit